MATNKRTAAMATLVMDEVAGKNNDHAKNNKREIQNAAPQLSNRVGFLIYAVSHGHSVVDPQKLIDKLESGPYPFLSMDIPRPASPHTALTRATKTVKLGTKLEWMDLGYDRDGDRVMLLCTVSADANAQDYEARKVGAALVKQDRTIEVQALPGYENYLAQLEENFRRELGSLGNTDLWRLADRIARRGGSYLRVRDGLVFVSDTARGSKASSYAYLTEFDNALTALNVNYRLRMIPFRGEDASVIVTDVSKEFMEEFQSLVGKWTERKDASAKSGRSMRRDGAETTVSELEELSNRYSFLREVFQYFNTEFETAADALRKEAMVAAGLLASSD